MASPGDDGKSGVREWVRWFLRTEEGTVAFVREVLVSVAIVLAIGAVLFLVSGLWPPMVAVESPSMHPNLQKGDLVFVMEEHRLPPPAAQDGTGVVTFHTGETTGYAKFGRPGDVIVYRKDGQRVGTPIIHRAMFWVDEGENWYPKADSNALGSVESCGELRNCPAPHAGFITKGDNNPRYDQDIGLSEPVKPDWIVGTAEFSIPYLGWVRLLLGGASANQPLLIPGSQTIGGTPPLFHVDLPPPIVA